MTIYGKITKKTAIVFAIALAVITITAILTGLLFAFPQKDYGVPMPEIENFKIDELTENQIVKVDEFGESKSTRGVSAGNTSGLKDYENCDKTYTKFKAEKITGISTLHAVYVNNDIITMDVKTEFIGSGKAKFVIIKDGIIVETFESGDTKRFTYQIEGESIILIKGLFENAECVTIEVARAFGGELPSFTR